MASHGADALFFYRWEPLLSGPEPWINHMVDADEYDTERRLATRRVIAELAPEEYRSLVEARVPEGATGSLLFVINRSGYPWTVTVTARGYRAEQVHLPSYGARRIPCTARSESSAGR